MSSQPPITVIIPAHNEEAVISKCLNFLLRGSKPDELDVVVVCNACTDRTAQVAGSFGPPVRVIETPYPSKTRALNLGDSVAGSFPRFYLDADALIAIEDVRKMADVLRSGRALALSPEFHVNLDGCGWALRAFYKINLMLPSTRSGIGGASIYGVSENGRQKFGAFPDLTADDTFFRLQFKPDEWVTLRGVYTTVFSPKNLSTLIRIKTRSYFGGKELRSKMPELWKNHPGTNRAELLKLFLRPWLWPSLTIYCYVRFLTHLRARFPSISKLPRWERDESSRIGRR